MNNFEKRMKKHRFRHLRSSILKYTVLIIFTFLMIYPLLWIIGASFNEGAKHHLPCLNNLLCRLA